MSLCSWLGKIFDKTTAVKVYIHKTPLYGQMGEHVTALQNALVSKGYAIKVDGHFGPQTKKAVMAFQKSFGSSGSGILGMLTLDKLGLKIGSKPVDVSGDYFGAPWIGADIDLLGRHETDKELNKRFVPEWALEGLPDYDKLWGNKYAWCSVLVNAKLRKVGIKGTNSAAAASWSKWGNECGFVFGAVLPIKHSSGGRHVCFFLYWIDEAKKIAATMDGNRGNMYCVAKTDLSGNGDYLVGGPRWPIHIPVGTKVSMADVLKKYPILKVGGVGGSTR